MGLCQLWKTNENIREMWNFEGNMNHLNNKSLDIKFLEGEILIKEENFIKEIEIKGKFKNDKDKDKKFCRHFIEYYKTDDNNVYFKAKAENHDYKFNFYKPILLKKNKDNSQTITGELIYEKLPLNLNLDLYLPNKPKKNKFDVALNDYRYRLKRLTKEKDIISNSICGYTNLGNTCYMNSSFQILTHIKELVEIIINNKDFEENVIGNINAIFKYMVKIYKDVRPVINPSIFVTNFKKEHDEYNNYSQMDSEMFLEDLIWNINLELSSLNVIRPQSFFWYTDKEKEILFQEYIRDSDKDSDFRINDLFYVCFIHEKKCINENCNNTSYYFDETTGLKLNFNNIKNKQSIDLLTLIKNNFSKEIKIKSSYLCSKCRRTNEIIEKTSIAKLPKILIISLQKTNNDNSRKIDCIVDFPDKFGIKEIVDIELCRNGNGRYKLFAINNHIGYSPRSGHYYSNIYLDELKEWFSFNDQSVEKINKPSPGLSNYILFYRQMELGEN